MSVNHNHSKSSQVITILRWIMYEYSKFETELFRVQDWVTIYMIYAVWLFDDSSNLSQYVDNF